MLMEYFSQIKHNVCWVAFCICLPHEYLDSNKWCILQQYYTPV